MEFKIGQNCSRKKSLVVWKIVKITDKEIELEKTVTKDKVVKRSVDIKLFTKRWVVTTAAPVAAKE